MSFLKNWMNKLKANRTSSKYPRYLVKHKGLNRAQRRHNDRMVRRMLKSGHSPESINNVLVGCSGGSSIELPLLMQGLLNKVL